MYSIKKRLRSKRGETLVEAIVSILLLAILMTTVTVMIQTSLRLTANSMREAEIMQELTFNPAFRDAIEQDLETGKLFFFYTEEDADWHIDALHEIRIYEDNYELISFYPPDDEDED